MRRALLTALLTFATTACTPAARGSGATDAAPGSAAPPDADAAPGEPSFAPTFDAVYSEVIAAHNCLLGLCHGEGASGGGLSLFPRSRARENLLARSSGFECRATGLSGVAPGSPEASLLWLKLQPEPPCGKPMPPDGDIDPRHAEQVADWITAGAPGD